MRSDGHIHATHGAIRGYTGTPTLGPMARRWLATGSMGETGQLQPMTVTKGNRYRGAVDKPFIVTNDYLKGKLEDAGLVQVQVYEKPPPTAFGALADVSGANRWVEGVWSGETQATPKLPPQVLAFRDDGPGSGAPASAPPEVSNVARNVAIIGAGVFVLGIIGGAVYWGRK
jgi:hypothetical protein